MLVAATGGKAPPPAAPREGGREGHIMKRTILIVAATGLLSVAGASLVAIGSTGASPADIAVVSEDATEATLTFTDANGLNETIELTRGDAGQPWRADVSGYPQSGVVFGNDEPVFASTAQLRAMSVSAEMAVRTFETAIADRPLDDVTIFRTHGLRIVVGLWQNGVITELWYAGSMVDALLSYDAQTWPNTCNRAVQLCCHEEDVPWDPVPPGQPTEHPWPNVDACSAAVANCGDNHKGAACQCLYDACNFCGENPDTCNDLEAWGIPIWEIVEAACVAGTACYEDPDDEDEDVEAAHVAVLVEILDRTQAVVDEEIAAASGE